MIVRREDRRAVPPVTSSALTCYWHFGDLPPCRLDLACAVSHSTLLPSQLIPIILERNSAWQANRKQALIALRLTEGNPQRPVLLSTPPVPLDTSQHHDSMCTANY